MYIYITVQKSNYICTFVHIQVRIHKYTFTPIKRKKLTVTIYIYIAKKPLCDLLDVLQTFTYRTYIDIYIYMCHSPLCLASMISPNASHHLEGNIWVKVSS